MRYMLLIYGDYADENAHAGKTPEEMQAMLGTWTKYTEDLQTSGKMIAGDALQPTTTATTVRVAANGTLTSDRPFAETKEQLGGFYMIDADNLDEAVEWAAKMPNLPEGGSVEVRPLMEFE